MPVYLVDQNKENLLRLHGIFVDYGEKEEFSHIRIATGLFSNSLAERNIPHIFEVYPYGDHTDEGAVPLLGLSKGPTKYPLSTYVYALASHFVYGVTTEVVRRTLRKGILK